MTATTLKVLAWVFGFIGASCLQAAFPGAQGFWLSLGVAATGLGAAHLVVGMEKSSLERERADLG